jgi:hypothetical protein
MNVEARKKLKAFEKLAVLEKQRENKERVLYAGRSQHIVYCSTKSKYEHMKPSWKFDITPIFISRGVIHPDSSSISSLFGTNSTHTLLGRRDKKRKEKIWDDVERKKKMCTHTCHILYYTASSFSALLLSAAACC